MDLENIANINQDEYGNILRQAVAEIRSTRNFVAKQLATATNSVYWNLGKLLFEKQVEEGYGSGVVNQLSTDLKIEFPDMGLSPRNLWNMKRYYERYYQADTKLLRSVAVLPWSHNLLLLDKLKSLDEAAFYATEVATKGWSRDWLLNAIKMDTYGYTKSQLNTNNFNARHQQTHWSSRISTSNPKRQITNFAYKRNKGKRTGKYRKMKIHTEHTFETAIIEHLTANSLYASTASNHSQKLIFLIYQPLTLH
jgi:DUF1016 N-terminal domain